MKTTLCHIALRCVCVILLHTITYSLFLVRMDPQILMTRDLKQTRDTVVVRSTVVENKVRIVPLSLSILSFPQI